MATTRRAVLLGGASSVALVAFPAARAKGPSPTPAIPPELFEPGIEAMAATVRSIVDMLKPSIVGVDVSDLRAVLQQGGRGAFGQGLLSRAEADNPYRIRSS